MGFLAKGVGLTHSVDFVQRAHLATERGNSKLPQDHLQTKHFQLANRLLLPRNRGRHALQRLDDGRQAVVLRLGLHLLLEVVVTQALEEGRNGLHDRHQVGVEGPLCQQRVALAERSNEGVDERNGQPVGITKPLEQAVEAAVEAEPVEEVDQPALGVARVNALRKRLGRFDWLLLLLCRGLLRLLGYRVTL